MLDMLVAAGFRDVEIQIKDNAADIISSWMPGSGAEKYVTSAYITAVKPMNRKTLRDDVRRVPTYSDVAAPMDVDSSSGAPAVGC